MAKSKLSDQELKEKLGDEQYQVTQCSATEPPFSGKYVNHREDGTYICVVCEQPLFKSDTKFESGSGWPSFWDVIAAGNVELTEDNSIAFMPRTEVKCANCGAHLGHVFNDGPSDKTGQRYCINSAALDFKGK